MKDFKSYLTLPENEVLYNYSLICAELAGLYQEVNMMMSDEIMTKSRGYLTAANNPENTTQRSLERAADYEAQGITVAIIQLRGKINSLVAEKEFIEFSLRRIDATRERVISEGSVGQHIGNGEVRIPTETSSSGIPIVSPQISPILW